MQAQGVISRVAGRGIAEIKAAMKAAVRRWEKTEFMRIAASMASPPVGRDVDRAFDSQVRAEDTIRGLVHEALGEAGQAVLAGGRIFVDLDKVAADYEGCLPRMISIEASRVLVV